MAAFNKVILMGNLTRDVELRYTASGTAVANMGIAVNEKYKDKEEVLFIDVTIWGKQAENAVQYLSKGSPVLVDGKLTFRTWEKDGEKKQKHEVTAFNVQYLSNKGDKPKEAPDEVSDIEPF